MDRLAFCLDRGELTLPEGRILCFGAEVQPPLPQDRTTIVTPSRPVFEALQAAGWHCVTAPEGPAACAVISVPRARARAQAWIAQAAKAVGDGPVIVDGAKTDGIDPLLKAVKARGTVVDQVSKAHGRCFWTTGPLDVAAWAPRHRDIGGFVTAPGVFSADGPDPGSTRLLGHLPALKGRVADLGAGWGYLTRRLLEAPAVTEVHLVEADHDALDCARLNLPDPRAQFHWADATSWISPALLDAVVMNPPFHQGRKGVPALGQAFITNAARSLRPKGVLYLVANQHLPYEAALQDLFVKVTPLDEGGGFKVLRAETPRLSRKTRLG